MSLRAEAGNDAISFLFRLVWGGYVYHPIAAEALSSECFFILGVFLIVIEKIVRDIDLSAAGFHPDFDSYPQHSNQITPQVTDFTKHDFSLR